MVPSIARQSVIIKCNAQSSVLLGNYELYYAAGLLKRLFHLEVDAALKPQELLQKLQEQLAERTGDEREQYLISMVMRYDASPEYDEQMRLLFCWGETEENLWQVNTDRTL